jgi:hypothetical protein
MHTRIPKLIAEINTIIADQLFRRRAGSDRATETGKGRAQRGQSQVARG